MDENAVIVGEIGLYLRALPWCDFELNGMSEGRLVVQGCESASYPFDIQITFHDVFHVQCNSEWKTDTSRDAILIVGEEDAWVLNIRYQVEMGNTIFRFIPEDLDSSFHVIAKGISYVTK